MGLGGVGGEVMEGMETNAEQVTPETPTKENLICMGEKEPKKGSKTRLERLVIGIFFFFLLFILFGEGLCFILLKSVYSQLSS